jgi:hypothetical protein
MPGLECHDRTKGLWRLDISPKVLRSDAGLQYLGDMPWGQPGDCNVARQRLCGEGVVRCQDRCSRLVPPSASSGPADLTDVFTALLSFRILAWGLAGSPSDDYRPSSAQHSLVEEIALGWNRHPLIFSDCKLAEAAPSTPSRRSIASQRVRESTMSYAIKTYAMKRCDPPISKACRSVSSSAITKTRMPGAAQH